MEYPRPSLTVDCVLIDDVGRILLIERNREPFAGSFALPGGFVDPSETVEQAAARELQEETGLVAEELSLLGVYSEPGRDPRGWVVSVAFLVRRWSGTLLAGDDASRAEFLSVDASTKLAFDHSSMLRAARQS